MNIFCIEQNYFADTQARRNEIHGTPLVFLKPQSALLSIGSSFHYPEFARELYCGCELVLRISKNGKDIQEKFAGNYYDSMSAGINFTALANPAELNEEELPWEKAKAWNNSSVAGMWMPGTNFMDKNDINFCLYKNREMVQLGNSGLMIQNFDTIISSISKSFFINTGDLIFTGTPAGIGKLAVGDILEVFIEDDSILELNVE